MKNRMLIILKNAKLDKIYFVISAKSESISLKSLLTLDTCLRRYDDSFLNYHVVIMNFLKNRNTLIFYMRNIMDNQTQNKNTSMRIAKKLNLILLAAMFQSSIISANPGDPSYDPNQVSISGLGTDNLTITNTPNAVIHWGEFSIAAGQNTHFAQENSNSSVLNQVHGNATEIWGSLTSNGKVFVINPNGILVGAGATIDTAGFIASTLNITDDDFLNGRLHFEDSNNIAEIINRGFIHTTDAGEIILIAPNIINEGSLQTDGGNIVLAAGQSISLSALSDPNIQFEIQAPENSVLNLGKLLTHGGSASIFAGSITHRGEINATAISTDTAGNIVLSAMDDINLAQGSVISANAKTAGNITLKTTGNNDDNNNSVIFQQGEIHADGEQAGTININAESLIASNAITADGIQQGGNINIKTTQKILAAGTASVSANASSGNAGAIKIDAGKSMLSSATYSATGKQGGRVDISADSVKLSNATVDVSGINSGGDIRIGGGFAGKETDIKNAQQTLVNNGTQLIADAIENGDGGSVAVWSDKETRFYGNISATAGAQKGNGGRAEVSAKDKNYTYAGVTDLSATNGINGELLLDPQNINIVNGAAQISAIELLDPNPRSVPVTGESWGDFSDTEVILLPNSNIAIADIDDSTGGIAAGAVYLFSADSTLISSLIGSTGNQLGSSDLTLLNGTNPNNFVIGSHRWDDGALTDVGAVTWVNGDIGLNGTVDGTNSLIGSSANDLVGRNVVALNGSNGNYVVESSFWDNGATVGSGAVTWVDGSNGQTLDGLNIISIANSIVAVAADGASRVGSDGITALSTGNYVVESSLANIAGETQAGAVTWGNGATGTAGNVANISLVGGLANDRVGSDGIVEVGNGNYVVISSAFSPDINTVAGGAVTWVNGAVGFVANLSISETVSASNSLVGSNGGDNIGQFGVTTLTNGNYVVVSPNVSIPTSQTQVGAVTWGDGNLGVVGDILNSQSIFGSNSGSQIGLGGVTALSNGNYAVLSPNWVDGVGVARGAVTWVDGTQASNIIVDDTNSLVGANSGDLNGSFVTALTNGNYVVSASNWEVLGDATDTDVGAITWINGSNGQDTNGQNGSFIDISNSLVGSLFNDRVGFGLAGLESISALSNGNYVVSSSGWNGGMGAVTWGNGTDGSVVGVVSASNSLIGSVALDNVGQNITILSNGNYVVGSPNWDDAGRNAVGAASWGDGSITGTRLVGTIDLNNSFIGSNANDQMGANILALSNGNYVIGSNLNGFGSVTWANGAAGISGSVTAANSLSGTTVGDLTLTGASFYALDVGDYIIAAQGYDDGATVDAGMFILADGTQTIAGSVADAITAGRGVTGDVADDQMGATVTVIHDSAIISSGLADSIAGGIDAGRAYYVDSNSPQGFSYGSGGDSSISTGSLESTLNRGTNVVLQASNDITQLIGANINVAAGGNGGDLTLQAGRSVLINADIDTDGGDLIIIANDTLASGVIDADRLAGDAEILMTDTSFITVNNLTADLRVGSDKTNAQFNKVTLVDANISANSINVFSAGNINATPVDRLIAEVSNVQEDFLTALNDVSDASYLDEESEEEETLQCR